MLLLYPLRAKITELTQKNLHSTMLLLYLIHYHGFDDYFLNLHSTMLLLYLIADMKAMGGQVFTFHYASTLSSASISSSPRIALFTFHYASTLSRRNTRTGIPGSIIYIPLCFYFIKTDRSYESDILNLHSTMLLLYPTWESTHCHSVCNLHSTMLLLYRKHRRII